MQRHLTAFEAHFMEATGAGLLAFVTTASGLAQTTANAATDATLGVLGASARFDGIELHG
jgi:hypothetical protein